MGGYSNICTKFRQLMLSSFFSSRVCGVWMCVCGWVGGREKERTFFSPEETAYGLEEGREGGVGWAGVY